MHGRSETTEAVRHELERLRREYLGEADRIQPAASVAGESRLEETTLAADRLRLVSRILDRLERRAASRYGRVINGTGVLLHTGLGRAVLAEEARASFLRELGGYSQVEVDLASGERNERESGVRELLGELTGAESATVVNNNAAATLLILAALARDREVIVSRGQLVEIGGSFRVPDILAESGARLVEVGTTNRTYLRDYERAITERTGLLLEVHTSNYAIRGFAHHTPLAELVGLGARRGLPVVSDLGSGCFVDLSTHGFEPEPLVRDSVRQGADLVCFSGDKLLGGPQAGIIVGSREAIARVRKHPLFRALRVDKVTLVLLEATLRLFRDPDTLTARLPILRQLASPLADVEARVDAFIDRLAPRAPALTLESVATSAQAGSGSLPDQSIPSRAVAVQLEEVSPQELATRLRTASPPVFARVHEGRALLDFRTVFPHDEEDLARVLAEIGSRV